MYAQDRANDDSERAFRPEPQLMERRPHRGSRTRSWRSEGSVGEHDRQAHDHVLDAAEAARLLAGGTRGAQPPDGSAGKGAREMAEREAKVVQALLKSHAVDAG